MRRVLLKAFSVAAMCAALLAPDGTAEAQVLPPPVPPPVECRGDIGVGFNCLGRLFYQTEFVTDVARTERVDVFQTQIVGLLSDGTEVFSAFYAAPVGAAGPQAGLAAASAAILGAGESPGAPFRTLRTETLTGTAVSTSSVSTPPSEEPYFVEALEFIGPAQGIVAGDLGICPARPTVANGGAGCQFPPFVFDIPGNGSLLIIEAAFGIDVTRTTTTTETWEVFERWEVVGRAATVPEPATAALMLVGLAGMLALRRRRSADLADR